MESHKTLYKSQRSYTPSNLKKTNRQLQEAQRFKSRRDRFQDSRNISPVPKCLEKEVTISLCPVDEANASPKNEGNTTRLAKIVCKATNPDKLTRQEAYLKRFIEYKENKKNMKKQQTLINKKKPFISAVNSNTQKTFPSLVPLGHHEEFRPPVGLKNPVNNEKVETDNKRTVAKSRQSIYTVVVTPPRKQTDENCKNKFPTARNISTNKSNVKTPLQKIMVVKKKISVPKAKSTVVDLVKESEEIKMTSKPNSADAPSRRDLKPRVLKMPPSQPISRAAAASKSRPMGAIPKIIKRTEFAKQPKKSPLKRGGARLAKSFKAKKPLNSTKAKVRVQQIEVKKGSHAIQDLELKTPIDFTTFNNFEEFVTSTQIKTSTHTIENGRLSVIGHSHKHSNGNTTVKRNILQNTNPKLVNEPDQNVTKSIDENEGGTVPKKFNFIRYSYCNDEMKIKENEQTPTKFGPIERPANYLSPYVSVARGKVSLKTEKEKRHSIYLPNVHESNDFPNEANSTEGNSTAIRRTLEAVRYFRKQLNDEINRLHQLCNFWEIYKQENLEKIQNASGEDMINVTVGQTRLLTSKKFMQFKGLIDRCESGATGINHVKCDGSEDTKPITSEDLEGFWSMLGIQIDNLDKRFENLNRWKLNDWEDPDAKELEIKKKLTKVKKAKKNIAAKARPNSALQQILRKMQVEMRKNKNKNEDQNEVVLTSLRQNPDRSATSKKTTPRRPLDNSVSRRVSIVVKDRKYFSPAATVISVFSPNRGTTKSSQDSPKMLTHIKKFNNALDNLQSSLGLRKSTLVNENSRRMSFKSQLPNTEILNNDCKIGNKENVNFVEEKDLITSNHKSVSLQSPTQLPLTAGRKSILKTPGTAKSLLRNVFFNEKLRVKKLNFLINEDGTPYNAEDSDDTEEEDLDKGCGDENQQRTLTLRNRKVLLRRSCEIVIPKK